MAGKNETMMRRLTKEEVDDGELLELILYEEDAAARKELAGRLVECFGSIGGAIHAKTGELQCVGGLSEDGAAYLCAIRELWERCSEEPFKPHKEGDDHNGMITFAKGRLCGSKTEKIEVYALDKRNRVTAVKTFVSDWADRASIHPEDLSGVIAEHKAHAVVIAHNHVYGSCFPSKADDAFTKKAFFICMLHGSQLYDHIVVAKNGAYSYALKGDLEKIADKMLSDLNG